MKKIAIISFFVSNNIGDILLANQLVNSFEEFEIIKIDFPSGKVFSYDENTSVQTRGENININIKQPNFLSMFHGYLYSLKNNKRFINRVATCIKEVDAIILGGGNMIMDIGLFPEYTNLALLYSKVAKKLNIPIFSLAVGVGPFRTRLQKKKAQKALWNCTLNFVRDEQSLKRCKELKVSCDLCGDSAFSFTVDSSDLETEKNCIAICIADYICVRDKISIQNYTDAWIAIIKTISKEFPDLTVSLYSSEKRDYAIIDRIYESVTECKNIDVVYISCIEDLIKLYSSTVVAVAMRMHSIIIAMLSRVSTVGVSWQPKVDSLFEMSKRQDCLFSVLDFQNSTAKEIVNKCIQLKTNSVKDIEVQNSFVGLQKEAFLNSVSKIKMNCFN